jgi:hypothetical protein
MSALNPSYAAVRRDFLAVHGDDGFPVHGAEVEQRPAPAPPAWHLECATVPESIRLADAFPDARPL